MARIGYARVSTLDQDLEIQLAKLKAEGCGVVRSEKVSGGSRDGRAELATVLDFLRPGDELVVTRLDRLGRDTRDVLNLIHECAQRQAFVTVLVLLSQEVASPCMQTGRYDQRRDGVEPSMTSDSEAQDSEARFLAYVEALSPAVGHADRTGPFRDYCLGLLMPGERKSVEPMAAVTSPARVSAQHQSLLHFVGQASWSDDKLLAKVRDLVLPSIERSGPIAAWIIDDTGFPKKGKHSVGVARQYCGQLGKQDNCQVAVSLSIANHSASLPVAYQLYLPEDWAKDPIRRTKAGVPADVAFATKTQIALRQIEATLAAGVPRGVVLMDAGYGADTDLRDAITALGLPYSAGILPNTTVWPQGRGPLPPKEWTGRGRKPTRLRRDAEHQPVDVKSLALGLPADTWQTVTWREGSAIDMTSRFARVRVRPAHRDTQRDEPRPEEWLLIEWPEDESEPIKYWLSTLPEDVSLVGMVDTTKLRWRIERDYQDLKQEVGLGHYEGRGWRGFHHHATLCIAAYGFLISERETIPPSGQGTAASLRTSPLHPRHRPRGAPGPARTPRPQLHHIDAAKAHGSSRQIPPPMSMLPRATCDVSQFTDLMTQ